MFRFIPDKLYRHSFSLQYQISNFNLDFKETLSHYIQYQILDFNLPLQGIVLLHRETAIRAVQKMRAGKGNEISGVYLRKINVPINNKAGFTLRDNYTIVTIALVIEVAIIFTGNRCTERDVVHIARQF